MRYQREKQENLTNSVLVAENKQTIIGVVEP
ncbi:hypothetical protein ES708_26284 [subsurface metagenome]